MVSRRPAIFLDRDGVINENVDGDYVRSWAGFRILPGALEAIASLSGAGYPIVIITNQAGVGRGLVTASVVDEIHTRLLAMVKQAGGRVEQVLYCPHIISDDCECRKPKPGLLTRAAQELGLDLARSVFVGDALSDVLAARAARCRPVLVRTGRGAESEAAVRNGGSQVYGEVTVVDDLRAAAGLILAG